MTEPDLIFRNTTRRRRQTHRAPYLSLSVEGHPDISALSLVPTAAGSRLLLKMKDGTIRSRLLFLFHPGDPESFSYTSGRLRLDRHTVRGSDSLRLYWHAFRGGSDLALLGTVSGRTLCVPPKVSTSDPGTCSC